MARSNVMGKMRLIAESTLDAKAALLKELGDLSGVEVLHSQVLVATRIANAKTAGGVFLPDSAIREDQFQGSIGLVIAIGPGAFRDGPIAEFHGVKLKLHDWVMFRPSDGLQLAIREVPCRLFEDTGIKMRVKDPQMFW